MMRELRREEIVKLSRMVELNQGQPLIAVAYARKSRQDKENASIDQQLSACKEFVAKHSKIFYLPEELMFSEDNVSGMNLETRKELQAALDVIRKGKAKVIIVSKLDRLSRDSTHSIQLIKEFDSLGAVLIAGDDQGDNSAAGILSKQVIMATGEFTVRRAVEDMMAAKKRKAELGFSCGGPGNYGYSVKNKRYVINPEEAIVVSRIYDLFNLGHSLKAITEILFTEGYRPRQAEKFSKATILAILNNERNYGTSVWNSFKKRKNRKRVSFLEFEEIVSSDAVEHPIITKSTFDLAQKMLETKTHSRQKLNTPGYLLSGLIKCSCGSKYIGSTSKGGRNKTIRRAYLCSARKEKHTCSAKDINADYLETAVKSYFNELIHKHVSVNGIPDEVFDMEFNDVSERTSKLQSDIQSTQKLIGKLVLEKAKTTSVNVQEALDIQISKKSLYLDQLKSSLSELNSRRMDYEQAKVKAPGFDYFHNLTLSKEFMHQHIEKITADANDIHIVFKQ